MKKRSLGRGLDALLLHGLTELPVGNQLSTLPIDLVVQGKYQPRTEMDNEALQNLAESIRTQGVVQPIIVRSLENSTQYEIIAGERRWRAAQLVGLQEIPALIKELSDHDAICLALIENIQREDLNPIDEARALQRLIMEFGMTHEGVAKSVGRSRSAVSNLIRLLDLSPAIRQLLEAGKIEMAHGRAILTLSPEKRTEMVAQIIKQGLSVRETEKLIQRLKENKHPKAPAKIDPNIRSLQESLSERLGTSISIKHSETGKGMIRINYNSLDELDGILDRIK